MLPIRKYCKYVCRPPTRRAISIVILLAAVALYASCISSFAHFDVTKTNDYNYERRRLCYVLSERVESDTNWSSWFNQAIRNWNSVSSKTGWEFHPCANGERPNIRFDFADKTSDGTSASSDFGAGDGSTVDEEFHVYILRDATGLNANGKISGGYNGWGETGKTTLDPILVIMHEMTHAMRLTHEGSGWSEGDLELPIGVGNHGVAGSRVPSADDLTQTSTSAANGKPVPTVKYALPPCGDGAVRQKALDELNAMLKSAQEEYGNAQKITTPRPQDSGEGDLGYKGYREAFYSNNMDERARAAKDQAQALSNIEYLQAMIADAENLKLCPPPSAAVDKIKHRAGGKVTNHKTADKKKGRRKKDDTAHKTAAGPSLRIPIDVGIGIGIGILGRHHGDDRGLRQNDQNR